jgi:xylan 1,4-beta-xylosidase
MPVQRPPYPNPLIPGFNPDPSCVLVDASLALDPEELELLTAHAGQAS